MHAIYEKKAVPMIDKMAEFAGKEIATRDGLHQIDDFPRDIWSKMADEGFLSLGIPLRYGGQKISYGTLVLIGEALVIRGHNMGLALSWIIHLLASGFMIGKFGTRAQRAEYLPKMADGSLTASIAFSELGARANPRHIKTTAYREGNRFILNGEKAYLTNGPLADLFIVYAVTGEAGGKKRFTAFLVPRENQNLAITEAMKLDFLRPSPHCMIRLESCSVPVSAILGMEGTALEDMARPCRALEDALLNGPIVGGLCRQTELILDALHKKRVTQGNDIIRAVGEMEIWRQTLRWMAVEAARRIEKKGLNKEYEELLISFRKIAAGCQSLAKSITKKAGIAMDGELSVMSEDICHTLELLGRGDPSRQRKIGEKIISGEGVK